MTWLPDHTRLLISGSNSLLAKKSSKKNHKRYAMPSFSQKVTKFPSFKTQSVSVQVPPSWELVLAIRMGPWPNDPGGI